MDMAETEDAESMSTEPHLSEHFDESQKTDEAISCSEDSFSEEKDEVSSSIRNSKESVIESEVSKDISDVSEGSKDSNNVSEETGLSLDNSNSYQDSSSRTSLSENFVGEAENDLNGITAGKLNDTLTEKEGASANIDLNVKNRISDLHCYICGKYFNNPVMLNCLHTFCLDCLKGLIFYKDYQKTECVVCGQKTKIPDAGMAGLPTNFVVKNLLTFKLLQDRISSCDICMLYGQEREVAGQCVDCKDMLCSECWEKHTYSRQTVKHTVVSLHNLTDRMDHGITRQRENIVLNCPQHEDEKLKFYCIACRMVVCRDCVLVSHNLHQVITADKVTQKIKDEVENKIELLNKSKKSNYEEIVKYEKSLEEEEKKQKQSLELAYKEIISTVLEKYKACYENLTEQYNYRRQQCEDRKENLEKLTESIEETEKNIRFLLDKGQDSEICNLQSLMKNQLDKLQNDLSGKGPAININATLPFVDIFSDNCTTLKKMTLFRTVRPKNVFNSDASKNKGKRETEKNPDSVQNLPTRLANLGLDRHPKVAMRPAGMWQGLHSEQLSSAANTVSLLGEYSPVSETSSYNTFGHQFSAGHLQNTEHVRPNLLTQDFHNKTNTSDCFGNNTGTNILHARQNLTKHSSSGVMRNKQTKSAYHTQEKTRIGGVPRVIGELGESLVLKATLSVKVLKDVNEPYIVGMTFIGRTDFAVCDSSNEKIKIFSICGKYLDVVLDHDPMTVTFCNGFLVWNASMAKVLTRATDTAKHKIHKKRFQPNIAHPVANFQEDKYLVANVQGKIAAFLTDGLGTLVSELEPRDSKGRALKDVHFIATGRNHLAVIDKNQEKVVVTDFQGRCKGEFCGNSDSVQHEWKPGSVCFDERENIFVTDSSRNRVILLSPRGELLKEWITLIDSPNCLACNGARYLLVSGSDKSVNVYQYAY